MRPSANPWFKIIFWGGSFGLVLAIGIIWFPREDPSLGFAESLYYTLRLFIFEHDLPDFPRTWPLIFIHFLAPFIALTAVGTAISYLFRLSPAFLSRFSKDHVVVCGVGRTGKLLAVTLKKRGVRVVGVDRGPAEDFEQWVQENRTPVVYGDFHARQVMEKAGVARARAVVFASGDDLANLEGAVAAYPWLAAGQGGPKVLWCHIASERLARTARQAVQTKGRPVIGFFDTYRIAAQKMLCQHFGPARRRGIAHVTVLGFGKFGGDLVEVLLGERRNSENWALLVVDKNDKSGAVASMARDMGMENRVSFQQADIRDLDVSRAQDETFFLCTDDDVGNLTAAMLLSGRMKGRSQVFVRMARWPMPAIGERLGSAHGITFVNINELVQEGFSDLPGIMSPARGNGIAGINLPEDDSETNEACQEQ